MKKLILFLLLIASCSTRVTLNYDHIDTKRSNGDWGNSAHSLFYNTLSGFLVRVTIFQDSSRVFIHSGTNPIKADFAKSWFVNINERLSPGEKSFNTQLGEDTITLVSQHAFVYRKGNSLFLRFRTYLSDQEITVKLIKDYWKSEINKSIWISWENNNINDTIADGLTK